MITYNTLNSVLLGYKDVFQQNLSVRIELMRNSSVLRDLNRKSVGMILAACGLMRRVEDAVVVGCGYCLEILLFEGYQLLDDGEEDEAGGQGHIQETFLPDPQEWYCKQGILLDEGHWEAQILTLPKGPLQTEA